MCHSWDLSAAEAAAADSEGGRSCSEPASARSGCGNVSASGAERTWSKRPANSGSDTRPSSSLSARRYSFVATRLMVPRTSSSSTRFACFCVSSEAPPLPSASSATMQCASRANSASASSRDSQPSLDTSKPSSAVTTAARRAALSAKRLSAAASSPASSESVTSASDRTAVSTGDGSTAVAWRLDAGRGAAGRRGTRPRLAPRSTTSRTAARIAGCALLFERSYAPTRLAHTAQRCFS
mmetsp:Transcript_18871/g.53772  ORF Transcript_18871/g.53772 Transcript_18871/m.53772 type:complete len:239 (-) Transcript_18871:53-769(-)